jgi:tetratricopeptide (TPR) repeat protein
VGLEEFEWVLKFIFLRDKIFMANKPSLFGTPVPRRKIAIAVTYSFVATLSIRFVFNLSPTFIFNLWPHNSELSKQPQGLLNCEKIPNKEACTIYNAGLQDLEAGNKFPGYEQMGRGSNDMGKPQDGLKYYTLAKNLPRSPYDDLTALSGQAWSLNLLHKPEEALKLANEVIVRDSNYPHIWPTKANAEMTLGRKKEACISAKKASELPEARRKQGRDLEQLIESACRIQ